MNRGHRHLNVTRPLTAGESRSHTAAPERPSAIAQSTALERLMTTQEAAALLNVSPSWLTKSAQRGRVPYTRIGRYVRFSSAQLRQIIADGEQVVTAGRAQPGSSGGGRAMIL